MYQKRCYLAVSRFGHVERRLGLDEEKRVEEEEVVNTAEETKPLTESPGPSCGNNSNVVLCCICSNHVCTTDFTVSCRAEHCLAIAHYLCAGYHSEKGAKRAKFCCSSCRAHQLLVKSSERVTRSPSPAVVAAAGTTQSTTRSVPSAPSATGKFQQGSNSDKCLCSKDNFCDTCLDLQSLATRLTESLSESRKENKALHLHILKLEERIESLETLTKPQKRIEAIEKELASLKSNMSTNNSRTNRPGPARFDPSKTRVFRGSTTYAQSVGTGTPKDITATSPHTNSRTGDKHDAN